MISDTLLVLEQGAEVLTRGISRAYPDISYFLDEGEEEPTAAVEESKPVKKESLILEGRTRDVNKKVAKSEAISSE